MTCDARRAAAIGNALSPTVFRGERRTSRGDVVDDAERRPSRRLASVSVTISVVYITFRLKQRLKCTYSVAPNRVLPFIF